MQEADTSRNPFDLVMVVPEPDDYGRLLAALTNRGVQLLDAELAPPKARVGVLAIVGEGGRAELFISRNQRREDAPPLEAISETFQALLNRGRYRHGALLVLGRDNLRGTPEPEGPYPALLRSLPEETLRTERLRRSSRGIAGIGDDEPSALSGLLWWELGRASPIGSTLRASYAFGRARVAFEHVEANWQAATAGAAARAATRAAQLELFGSVEAPAPPRLKYEVMPTSYLEASAETNESWAVPRTRRPTSWRPFETITLDIGGLDQADFEESPLAVRAFELIPIEPGRHRLRIGFDIAPRLALGVPMPSAGHRLRYGLFGNNVEVLPIYHVASAGETVEFEIIGEINNDTELALTCTGSAEQNSMMKVTPKKGIWGENGLRLCSPS